MEPLRVGVIGAGYWGPNLIRNFVELPEANVVAVADLDEKRLAAIKGRFPEIKTTTDYRQLFAMDLNAVVVATPPLTHYELARECMEHNLHVMVEKPFTLTVEKGQALCEFADERGLTLMVGHTFEYNPAVRAVKEIIDSGQLGTIYYIDAVRVNLGLFQDGLNVLWDLAPHDISILRYLLGSEPLQVNAHGAANIFPGVHDVVYVNLEFENQVMANIHVSWLHPSKVRKITIVGSEKMLIYDDVEPLEKIRIYDKGVEKPPYTDTFGDFQLSYRFGDIVIPHIKFTEPLRIECKHFIDSIVNGTRPQSSGWDGLQVVKTLEMAEQSLHSNGNQQQIAAKDKEDGYATVHNK